MANIKISGLSSASTPLTGCEIVPLNQSGVTDSVSVANLTAGRAVSAASLALTTSPLPTTSGGTGLTSFTSGGVVYASSTSALATSSAFTFNGTNVSFTGNLIPTTAGKGINFTANTPASGKTSQLLNWYEEGTWTPAYVTTGGSFTYSANSGTYVRVGRLVTVTGWLSTSAATVGTGAVTISGLPFPTNASAAFRGGCGAIGYSSGFTVAAPTQIYWTEGQSYVNLQYTSAGGTVSLNATNLTTGASGNYIFFSFSYPV